jgi:hypothetical protein
MLNFECFYSGNILRIEHRNIQGISQVSKGEISALIIFLYIYCKYYAK